MKPPNGVTPAEGRVALSIVTTLYRSEPYVREFYSRMVAAAEAVSPSFEIIFVNDGSPDAAAGLVAEILPRDRRVTLVDLSRNFGHHQAAVAGLNRASGDRVFIIDVDLEEQPEWLAGFVADLDRTAADVVYGIDAARKGSTFKKGTGVLFWKLFNGLSETPVPANPCTVRLMSRRYLRALLTLPDRNLFLAGNYAWAGFHQVARPVEKKRRPTRSSYTLTRLLALFLDAITSFTSYPLKLIFVIGAGISSLALVAGVGLFVRKIYAPETISLGWASLIVSIWFLGGIIVAFLGVIGIYVSKVFNETKQRPLYIVRETRGGPTADTSSDTGG